jgi:drug/metabolite transporter (DMT)-like permease
MATSRPGAGDYALLLMLAAIWGSSFLFIKLAVETVPAATTTALRLGIAALFLLAVAWRAGQPMPRGRKLWSLILASALFGNALPFTLISWGEESIDSGLAAILIAVMPLSTILLAHLFTSDEKLNARKAIGVVLGFAGIIVLIGPEKLTRLGDDTLRQLAVAGAAFCYGINAIVTKSLVGLPRRSLAAALMVASTLMLVPVSLLLDRPWTLDPSNLSLLSILALGLAHTAIGTLMLFAIVGRQGASFFSQINFLVPVFGVFWGVALLAERLPAGAYWALALILAGIAVARGGRRSAATVPGGGGAAAAGSTRGREKEASDT